MGDEKGVKAAEGNYLAETDQDLKGCSVMISYSRKDKAFVKKHL